MLKKLIKYYFILSILALLLGVYTLLAHSDYGGPFSKDASQKALVKEGAEIYRKKNCNACHGSGGRHPVMDTYPIIAGQPVSYLKNQIKDIMEGRRQNGLSSQMKASIGYLTDREIAALSYYINSQ